MSDHEESTRPSWIEADSFRETTLRIFGSAEDREALRRVGRLLHDLAVDRRCGPGGESDESDESDEPLVSAQLRAVAADLRYLEGYLEMLGHWAEWSTVSVTEEALAHFAGRMARRVGALAEAVEEEL